MISCQTPSTPQKKTCEEFANMMDQISVFLSVRFKVGDTAELLRSKEGYLGWADGREMQKMIFPQICVCIYNYM